MASLPLISRESIGFVLPMDTLSINSAVLFNTNASSFITEIVVPSLYSFTYKLSVAALVDAYVYPPWPLVAIEV